MTTLIVTFVDERYVRIAQNWIFAIRRLGLEENVLLITLDSVSDNAIYYGEIRKLYKPLLSNNLSDLWIHRVRCLSELLIQGYDVVHSDADAVWLCNPLNDLISDNFDMMFSQGTLWPPDIHEKWGLVLCCGLFGIRGSSKTKEIFLKLIERVLLEHDDQVAFNRLIDEYISGWEIKNPRWEKIEGKRFVTSLDVMKAKSGHMNIGVLPFHQYPRRMLGRDGVIVGHPLSGKTVNETEFVLRNCGLWFI